MATNSNPAPVLLSDTGIVVRHIRTWTAQEVPAAPILYAIVHRPGGAASPLGLERVLYVGESEDGLARFWGDLLGVWRADDRKAGGEHAHGSYDEWMTQKLTLTYPIEDLMFGFRPVRWTPPVRGGGWWYVAKRRLSGPLSEGSEFGTAKEACRAAQDALLCRIRAECGRFPVLNQDVPDCP